VSEKERLALELEQKLESEKQASQSAKSMLENKISEAQASKSEWQDLKHQVRQQLTFYIETCSFEDRALNRIFIKNYLSKIYF